MAWKKAPEFMVEAFYAALPDDPRVDRRKMFGYPCAFVNGNMFTGTHEDRIVVRLGEDERTKLLRLAGATAFEPMPGRFMREYVVVPPAMRDDARKLRPWMTKALGYAATLPVKTPKPRARKAK